MLKDVVAEYEDIEDFKPQKNENVECYFKEKLKCENIPEGVLEFYNEYDGCVLSINDVFALKEITEELLFFKDFLKAIGIDGEKEKYIPIANDGKGGYYAFLSNKKEETIYYFNHEFLDNIQTYTNFEEFLKYTCKLDKEL